MENKPKSILRKEREKRGWSRNDLATQIGCDPKSLARWEAGTAKPRSDSLQMLCEIFKKTPQELGFIQNDEVPTIEQPHDRDSARKRVPILDPMLPTLPIGIDTIVGRDAELADMKRHLLQPKDATRVISALYGLPGVGKSAFALALAHDSAIREHFSDGILWCGLSYNPNILNLLSRWGMLLNIASNGIRLETLHTCGDWVEALRMTIGSRSMLILIDDVWKLDDAVQLKVGGPNCAHIITTRFPEIALLYAGTQAIMIRELEAAKSIQILEQLIPYAIAEEPTAVRDLVQAVGGLPLALLIIGKHLQVETRLGQKRRLHEALQKLKDPSWWLHLNLGQMLDQRLHGSNDVPNSVYAAIELSYRQLDVPSQVTLCALATFPAKPNSFSETAALAVANTTTTILNRLLDASLLEIDGNGRYTLHQTIAAYGKLQNSTSVPFLEQRFATFFLSYIQTQPVNYNDLAQEMANISQALQLAYDLRMTEAFVSGTCSLTPYWLARGLYDTADQQLECAKQIAETLNDVHRLAQILLCMGRVAERYKELRQAVPLYEHGLALVRHRSDSGLVLGFLINLGEVMLNLGDLAAAETYVKEGLALAQEQQREKCQLLKTHGEIVDYRGEFQYADALYLQALDIAKAIQDEEMMSVLLQNMGTKAFKENRFDEAEKHSQQGLELACKIGSLHRQSALLTNLGMIAIRQANYQKAEDYCQRGLSIARDLQNKLRMSNALQNLGILQGLRGHGEQAEKYLDESIELAREINQPWLISEGLGELGEVLLRQEKIEQAEDAFNEALAIAQEKTFDELRAVAIYGLAHIAEERREYERAYVLGKESLGMLEKEGHYRQSEVKEWLCRLKSKMEDCFS